jgi:hypothetical protein
MTKPPLRVLFLGVLLSIASSCNSGSPERPSLSKSLGAAEDSRESRPKAKTPGSSPDEQDDSALDPTVEQRPLNLKLGTIPEVDAYDFTFGSLKLSLDSKLENASVNLKRGILLKEGTRLSEGERGLADRLCKDVGLSETADAFEPAKTFRGTDLYLMWRSHFGADVKIFLTDYLARNSQALRCVLRVSLEAPGKRESTYITLDPLADSVAKIVGSSKAESALAEGLLMVANEVVDTYAEAALVWITAKEKMMPKVAALNSVDVTLGEAAVLAKEQCYLIALGGTSKPYNPKSASGALYTLTAKAEFNTGDLKPKNVDGRMIKACEAVKFDKKGPQISSNFSCGDYFAIKDQGLEAGCAWDLPIMHKLDPENSFHLSVLMNKLPIRTRDGTRVNEQSSQSVIPVSDINDVRDAKVNVSALAKGQAQLIEDALDLWIALDQKSYREVFYNHIKTIGWDAACMFGGYANYGSEAFTWCGGGSLTEPFVARRFQDPVQILYRAMLAYHESLHTRYFKHDYEDRTYAPCAGTSKSAVLSTFVLKNCSFDFCNQIKPWAALIYKNEMNYDYSGDNTGRKAQGECKLWSNELGISGEGF